MEKRELVTSLPFNQIQQMHSSSIQRYDTKQMTVAKTNASRMKRKIYTVNASHFTAKNIWTHLVNEIGVFVDYGSEVVELLETVYWTFFVK